MAISLARKVSRLFRKLALVGRSKNRNIFGVHPLVVSTVFIAFSLLLASLARKIVNSFLGDHVLRQMLLEFIATVELCAACFELIVVADNWGVWAYAAYLFLLTLWWGASWGGASACPYGPVEEVLEGSQDFSNAVLLVFAQILGAIATFRYVQLLWAMELVETHRGKAFEQCVADLQVHMLLGALIEGVATCACRMASKALSLTEAKYGSVVDALFGTMMVVAAFNFSGGYFNPALATSLKLGCRGNTFVEHLVVYWLGAIIGSVVSVFFFRLPMIQKFVCNAKATKVE